MASILYSKADFPVPGKCDIAYKIVSNRSLNPKH